MKRFFVCLVVLLFACEKEVDYIDFHDLSDLTLNGHAAEINNNNSGILHLTNKLWQSSSAFCTNPIQLRKDASFSTYFQFQILDRHGLGGGADGLVFVVQTLANNVGSAGGGIGYEGIAPSVGVEFDTYNNSIDGDGNHIGINLDGNMRSVAVANPDSRIDDGGVWHAWVDYNGRTHILEVRASREQGRPQEPLLSFEVDLSEKIGSQKAFVGFTSGTGAGAGNHEVLVWEFVATYSEIGKTDPWLKVLLLLLAILLLLGGARLIQDKQKKKDECGDPEPKQKKKLDLGVIAFAVVSQKRKGGHPTLGKNAVKTKHKGLLSASKEEASKMKMAVAGASDILMQCGLAVHVCETYVLDADIIPDLHTTKTLAEALFDEKGITQSGEDDNPPDPLSTLHIDILSSFETIRTKYTKCAFLFFVNDVERVGENNTLGIGTHIKNRPVAIVDNQKWSTISRTIAHELAHGLSHSHHVDEEVEKPPEWFAKTEKEAEKVEKCNKKAEEAFENKETAHTKAQTTVTRLEKNKETALSELTTFKETLFQNDSEIKKLLKNIKDTESESVKKKYRKRIEKRKVKIWTKIKQKGRVSAPKTGKKQEYQQIKTKANALENGMKQATRDLKAAQKALITAKKELGSAEKKMKAWAKRKQNLMVIAPEGNALMEAQCDLITQFVKKHVQPCPCPPK